MKLLGLGDSFKNSFVVSIDIKGIILDNGGKYSLSEVETILGV